MALVVISCQCDVIARLQLFPTDLRVELKFCNFVHIRSHFVANIAREQAF